MRIGVATVAALALWGESLFASEFQPRGKMHLPIGLPNSRDTLKTFVEAEGNFSPGFGSYGIFFAVEDSSSGKITSPTDVGVKCTHGLEPGGLLIPWSEWRAGGVTVRSEVCAVKLPSPKGEVFVTAARVQLMNAGTSPQTVSLHAQLQSLGAAGGPVKLIAQRGPDVFVEGRPVLICDVEPASGSIAVNAGGEASIDLAWKPVALPPGQQQTFGFICPVLPGRRAVGHQWDGTSKWAQLDRADPIFGEGGALQPDPGAEFYRGLKVDALFAQAGTFWKNFTGDVELRLPDPRWAECFAAIAGHAAMAMNEGAPDVAVVNYNVFNRDGVYVANILQKSGQPALAVEAIDYFLAHPFNGRVEPEADNPGQVLWILGESTGSLPGIAHGSSASGLRPRSWRG